MHLTHRKNAPDVDIYILEITTQHMVKNVLTATAEAITLPYVGITIDNDPELSRTAEECPTSPREAPEIDQLLQMKKTRKQKQVTHPDPTRDCTWTHKDPPSFPGDAT